MVVTGPPTPQVGTTASEPPADWGRNGEMVVETACDCDTAALLFRILNI